MGLLFQGYDWYLQINLLSGTQHPITYWRRRGDGPTRAPTPCYNPRGTPVLEVLSPSFRTHVEDLESTAATKRVSRCDDGPLFGFGRETPSDGKPPWPHQPPEPYRQCCGACTARAPSPRRQSTTIVR